MPFEIEMRQQPELTVVHLSGELDMETAPILCSLYDTLVTNQPANVLVDLAGLSFCDSIGLSALIHGYNVCRSAGGTFRITGDTGLVSRVLRTTGVRTLLTEADSGLQNHAQNL